MAALYRWLAVSWVDHILSPNRGHAGHHPFAFANHGAVGNVEGPRSDSIPRFIGIVQSFRASSISLFEPIFPLAIVPKKEALFRVAFQYDTFR